MNSPKKTEQQYVEYGATTGYVAPSECRAPSRDSSTAPIVRSQLRMKPRKLEFSDDSD